MNYAILVTQAGTTFAVPVSGNNGGGGGNVNLSGYAKLASPAFSGVPTAPTAAANTQTNQLATTLFVMQAVTNLVAGEIDLAGYAKTASPALTGIPTAPTAAHGTNTDQIATTAFVTAALTGGGAYLGSGIPIGPGTATAGTSVFAAHEDHVHPYPIRLLTGRTISLTGVVAGSLTFDGSQNVTMNTTFVSSVAVLGNVAGQESTTGGTVGTANTAARSDHTHPLQTKVSGNAGTATALQTARTITLDGAVTGNALFDGTANITITTSGVTLGSTAGASATTLGTVGTAATAARSDHSHPLQTTVTGNAGTASALQTARTIALSGTVSGSTTFNGSANATITTQLNTINGTALQFWLGTAATLPATRTSGVIYMVEET